jgi:hypothetical protein
MKVKIFNLENKTEDRRVADMKLTSIERLYVCLELMDLSFTLSEDKFPVQNPHSIDWIELHYKHSTSTPQ